MTRQRKTYADYFTGEDHKQIAALPKKWKDASRFKVGQKIRMLPGEYPSNLDGKVATITEVINGRGSFEDQWFNDEFECWVNESRGWMVVDFGNVQVSGMTVWKNSKKEIKTTRAVHLDGEGVEWERVK